jgi:predicted lipase
MEPIGSSYNGPTARICAELSFNAYKSPSDIKQRIVELIPNAAVRVHNGLPGNTQVVVVSTAEAIFVVFRGTIRSARSFVANLRVRRKRWGNGLVHRGFLRIMAGASPLILQDLRDYQSSTKSLCFAGHSQGAAAAYLMGVTFALRIGLQAPSAVYTFGQPRAGDAQFSRDAEARLQRTLSRITNGRDFVVGVPFVWNGYDHTREDLHYGQDQRITRRRQSAGQGWPAMSFADHSMLQYLRLATSHVNESLELV